MPTKKSSANIDGSKQEKVENDTNQLSDDLRLKIENLVSRSDCGDDRSDLKERLIKLELGREKVIEKLDHSVEKLDTSIVRLDEKCWRLDQKIDAKKNRRVVIIIGIISITIAAATFFGFQYLSKKISIITNINQFIDETNDKVKNLKSDMSVLVDSLSILQAKNKQLDRQIELQGIASADLRNETADVKESINYISFKNDSLNQVLQVFEKEVKENLTSIVTSEERKHNKLTNIDHSRFIVNILSQRVDEQSEGIKNLLQKVGFRTWFQLNRTQEEIANTWGIDQAELIKTEENIILTNEANRAIGAKITTLLRLNNKTAVQVTGEAKDTQAIGVWIR